MRTLNVLIVDDEAFVVDWIISLLDSQGDLPLNLFSCYGVTEAERMIEERRIDILLSDIRASLPYSVAERFGPDSRPDAPTLYDGALRRSDRRRAPALGRLPRAAFDGVFRV